MLPSCPRVLFSSVLILVGFRHARSTNHGICTKATRDPLGLPKRINGRYVEHWLEYPPFKIPCPPVGERVNVAFSYFNPNYTTIDFNVHVSHDGEKSADGISFLLNPHAHMNVSECRFMRFSAPGSYYSPLFSGKRGCHPWHYHTDRPIVCSTTVNAYYVSNETEQQNGILIWNTGACVGNISIGVDAAQNHNDEPGDSEKADMTTCLGMEQVCPNVTSENGGPLYNSTAMTIEYEQNNTCTISGKGSMLPYGEEGLHPRYYQRFPDLVTPCPRVGERLNVRVTYRNPAGGAARLFVGVSHSGKTAPAGISVGGGGEYFSLSGCQYLPLNYDDFVFKGRENSIWCEDGLGTEGVLCLGSIRASQAEGVLLDAYASIWNDGACEGNLTVRATIRGRSKDPNSWNVTCLSGVEEACPEVLGGIGGQPPAPNDVVVESSRGGGSTRNPMEKHLVRRIPNGE